MKWAIVGLFGLGVVAAIAAALLVVSLNNPEAEVDSPDQPLPEVPVVVATKELDPMTIVTPELVTVVQKKRNVVPLGSFTDTSQVLSKVLKVKIQPNMILEADHFYSKGSPAELAAALKPGERAVNVALNDSMGIETLLYPGSLVDVMCSMNLRSTDGAEQKDDPIAITLCEKVRVLAVGQQTIVHQSPEGEGDGGSGRGARPTVALAVTTEQAEKLKLAMQEGSVSLSLRNPLDSTLVPVRLTGLPSMSPLLGGPAEQAQVGPQARERRVLIMRGGTAEVRTFEQPLSQAKD
jgi:pilus assembly protein CpaB